MKLVVGLGNPGKEYKNTRHNIGFMVLDNYIGKVSWKNKNDSKVFVKDDIVYIKPQTYMNLSGIAVSKIAKYYNIKDVDILVIHDDLDLDVGTYRIKRNSSSGGHNGIKSIINELNSDKFNRLKIGIGKDERIPTDKYVLGKFKTEEEETIKNLQETFNNIINDFINSSIEYLMDTYNRK